jgi:hypothetical protein
MSSSTLLRYSGLAGLVGTLFTIAESLSLLIRHEYYIESATTGV